MSRLLAVLPNVVFAVVFLVAWIAPEGQIVRHLFLVMLFEFILIHASAFMGAVVISRGPATGKALGLLGFLGLYSLFAFTFAGIFEVMWPVFALAAMTAAKIGSVFFAPVSTDRQKNLMVAGWLSGTLCYMGALIFTAMAPVPALGITPEVVKAQDLPGTGSFVDDPHVLVAAGFLYFLLLAIVQWRLHGAMTPRQTPPAPPRQIDREPVAMA